MSYDSIGFKILNNSISESINKYIESITKKILKDLNKEEMTNKIIDEYVGHSSKQELNIEIAEDIFLFLCKEKCF